jgi:membrane protein
LIPTVCEESGTTFASIRHVLGLGDPESDSMLEAISKRFPLVSQTVSGWIDDKVPQLGAALAFYTALSIAPLLVISLGVAALVFGEEAARGQVLVQMRSLVGDQGAQAIQEMIANANKPTEGVIATGISVVILLAGASGVFGQLQQSLNAIWKVQPKPGRGIMGMIRDRFLSVAMVFGIAFLLLVSLILDAAITSLTSLMGGLPKSVPWIGEAFHLSVSLVVITLLFAMIFKYLPDVKIRWRDVWLGAIITAALFTIGKFAIGLYLGHSSMASSYGVAGSFVVLLVWVYYSAQILFFGVEFTKAYANRYGGRIAPSENAELVSDGECDDRGRPKKAG